MAKAGKYDEKGNTRNMAFKNLESINKMYNTNTWSSIMRLNESLSPMREISELCNSMSVISESSNTMKALGGSSGMKALVEASNVTRALNESPGIRELIESQSIRALIESPSMKELINSSNVTKVLNQPFSKSILSELSKTSESMINASKSIKSIIDESYVNNSLWMEMASVITSLEFDDDGADDEDSTNELRTEHEDEDSTSELRLEPEDLANISDLFETVEHEIGDENLTDENRIQIIKNTWLEFKDKNPTVAKVIKVTFAVLIWIMQEIVSQTISVRLFESPNDTTIYQEINYYTTYNYYTEGESITSNTEIKIYDKDTNELLYSGYVTKEKLNEMKISQEELNNNEVKE